MTGADLGVGQGGPGPPSHKSACIVTAVIHLSKQLSRKEPGMLGVCKGGMDWQKIRKSWEALN